MPATASPGQLGQRADAPGRRLGHVDFHEALEVRIALYPPIWVALGGLEEAIETAPRPKSGK